MNPHTAITELALPDFDLPGGFACVVAWHAVVGQRVAQGERLVEIAAGDVTVELAAPVTGVLVQKCAAPAQPLAAGQTLARLRPQ